MQNVDLFESAAVFANQSGGSRGARAARSVTRLTLLARKGASKVHPAAALVDAGLSVLDAGQAYLRYSAAKAETQGLKAQLEALEHQLANDMAMLNMERQAHDARATLFRDELQAKLEQNQQQVDALFARLHAYRTIFYELLEQVKQQRYRQQGELYEFMQLEAAAHTAMREYLACLIAVQD